MVCYLPSQIWEEEGGRGVGGGREQRLSRNVEGNKARVNRHLRPFKTEPFN